MPIPVIPALPWEQLGRLYPAISQCFDVGKKTEGAEGKKSPTNPTKMVQIFYILKTANSKGKKFKALMQASQRVPLPGKGCEIPSHGTMGEGVTSCIQQCCEHSPEPLRDKPTRGRVGTKTEPLAGSQLP